MYVSGAKLGHPAPVINLAFSRPTLGVPGSEKVVKIRPKHYLAVMMGNDKNCTPKNCLYVSGAKPSHLRPVFNFSCSGGAWTRKVVKTWPKHFSTLLTRNEKNCTPKSFGMIRVQNRVFRARFSTSPAAVVPAPRKVVKIWLKHFSTVLTENDMNITTNYVGMFLVANWAIRARFSTLPALVRLGPDRVVKTWPKQLLATLTTNDRNCSPNNVSMFRVQNRVIQARLLI